MQSFKKLKVWKDSHQFTLKIYRLVEEFPRAEVYRLTDQLLRASYQSQ